MTDDLQRGDDLTPAPNAQASEQSGDQAIHPSNDQREVALGQAEAPLLVSRPAAGQSVVLDPAPDQIVVLNFDPAAAQVQVEAGNLVLGFDDDGNGSIDSRIVFLDLAAEGGESAIFQIAGTEIDSSVLVGQALALAGQDEAPLGDVAAGPGATSGGGSAYDDNLGNVLDLLVAQGVIPPTTLQFGLIDLEDSPVAVDEAEGVISLTFRSIVDDGEGGVTTFEGGFEDWQPDQDGCEGATVPMEVLIAFTPNDNEELVSFSLSGIPEGATLFVGGTAAANAVDTSGGSSPLLTPADLATGIYLLPPEDSGDDIPLTVTATISDPDSGDTSVISGTATAIIDSVADNPFALFDGLADGFEGFDGGEGASEEEIEAFLGLESGALDAAANDSYGGNGTEEATDGTAIKTTLNLQAGDRVEMTFNFLDAEGSGPGGSYQDFAFVSVNGEVFPIASVGSANEDSDAFYLGSGLALQWNEESGYFTLSVTAEAGGSYELGIGVMNEGDTAVDSGLLVDNLIVTRGEDVVFQDDFTSFDNWEVLAGGFTAIVGDVNTNEDMPGAPSQGLLVATGPFDLSAAGCEVITSYIGYNEDNGTPVFEGGEGQGGDDCAADEEPIFGAGFIAAVTDGDGSESLTKITISTFAEGEPGGSDPHGLEVALSGEDDPAATNFMVGEQVLVDGGTVEVMATFADGSTGSVTATIEIADGVLTLLFDGADRVQSVDLSSGSATPFQVRLPQHSDDDFQLNLEVTATEYDIDGELTLDNNEATHQAVLNVEVKAVADGAEVNAGVGSASFVEDGEADPANHGADSGETGLEIPLETLGATLVDRDGSEAITELKVTLQGADAGATFIGADGEPLGATLQVEVADGVFITADVAIAGQTLTLTFGEDAAGYDIDVSGLVQVKLPVDDSDDFTVKVEATTTEVHPEGDVACESKTTETSFDVHVGGIAGPAAVAFGDYANFPGCGAPTVEGNILTLSLFEDGQGAVEGQAGEGGEAGPQVVPLFFTAAPQDADGSEKITQVTLSLDGAAEGTVFVAEGTPLAAGDEVAGATVSFDGDTLVLTFAAPGADAIDLSAIGVQVPQHSDDDFAVQIATTTTEYDDDGSGAAVTSHETAATINVMLDAVADPVTVDITVNDSLADAQNQFSPGETGSVKVEAGFGDVDDGSETHTVTVEIPEGFTVGALEDLPEGVVAEVNGDGNVVFTVGAGVAALDYTFEVTAPDDVTDEDLFGFTATAQAEETSTGDAECSEENNLATAIAEQEVSGEAAGTPEVGLQVDGDSGVKEDAQTEVQITADVTTVGDTLSQVVVTAPAGWVLNATAGGGIASVAGDGSNSLTLTLTGGVENFAGTILATPPADTDVDAEFTVTATAVDGLDSAEGSDDFPVTVDAILDEALELGADGSASGDEAAAAQTFSLNLDSSVVAPFTGSGDGGADTDGSESTTVTLTLDSPLPAGALLSTTAAGATVTDNGGSYTISGPDLEAAIDGLQVQVPGGFEGVISGTVSAESREANTPQGTVPASGQEPDTSDNVSTDSVDFTVTVTGGEVAPEAAIGLPEGVAAIKEDSSDNVVEFSASADNATDELTSVVIELPGVAQGDVDVAQIVSDLSGNGSVLVSEAGGTTSITITFTDASDVQDFASSFTLDAPVEDSDLDLSGVKITAHAKDITDPLATGSDGATTTIVVDAVLDEAGAATQGTAPSESESTAAQEINLDLSLGFVSAGFALSGAGGADEDGSEAVTAVTVTLSEGVLELGAGAPAGSSLTDNGGGSYTLNVADAADYADAIAALQVEVPAGYEGTVTGSISVTTEEVSPNGGEPDTSDNVRTLENQFSATVTGGTVVPTAAIGLAGQAAAIKEDSSDNQVDFTANAGDATDELTSVVIELPGVAQGDVDVAQITTDLAGNGTAVVSEAGGTTTITITFDAGSEPGSFASSFTLDAPVEDSDVDLSGVKITAHAQDKTDNTEIGQGGETTTIVVDAVLDEALELGADGATGGSEQATPQTLGLGLDATLGSAGFGLSLAGGADGDGSESTTVTLTLDNPLPAGAVLSSTAGTLSGGPLVYTISGTDLAAAVDGLQVQVPGGYEGVISGTVSSASREANTPEGTLAGSGLEPDTSDNTASDSVNFTVTVTGGDVTPTAALALAGGGDCIKEDSTDNQVNFTSNAGDGTDELTSVVIELPGVATGDVDVAQIVSDLAGNGSVLVNEAGGTTTITVTFFDGSQPGSFASSFTLDAPVADSDLDLQDLQITAYAQDKTDNTETGSGGETIDIVVDAVADGETDGLSVAIEVKDSGDAGAEFAPGETGTVKVSASFGDSDDGSEAHTVVVDVPDDFTVGQPLPVTPAGVTASVNADGDVEFVVQNGTAGFTDYVFEVTASNAIADPDSYTFTATAKAVEQNSNSDPEAGDLECTTGDNEATATAQDEAEVEPVETLAGKIVINEVGLGVSEAQTVDFPGQGQDDFHVDAGLNFIEIRNIANNASGVNGQAIEQLDIEIVGPDGTKVTIDLSTLSGSVGSHGLAAKEYLVLYEDGTWAVYDAGGELKNANSFGSYTSNAPWGFGETTSDELAINMMQEVAGGTFAHVDGLLANGADTGSLTHTAGAIWEAAGDGSTAAQALFGDVVDNAQFNGQIGDQWSVLGSILAPGQAVLSDPESLGQAVNDGVDDATKVFARVYSDNVPGQAQIPGDTVNGGDPEMDSDQELDWTTSNQSTQGGINQASGDLNPQDDTDDFDPAQGAGSNDENAGQTVVDVSEGGEADTANEADDNLLEGGRGQDFLFGDDDANTLLGGDHNDFLFGDKGDDRLEGEGGADLLTDVDGEDVLIGGAGDDVLIGGEERLEGSVAVSDASGDLLVGDNVIEGEVPTFNVVYVIDVSGSMAWAFDGDENPASGESRLDYAKQAFLTLNQQIIDAGFAGVVNIKVVPFASSASDAGSPEFDRADDAALESFINGLTANGGTQYESPLQVAANWLREDVGGTERHEGSQNFVFFLSDGGDNNGYNPNSGSLGTDLYGADPAISNLTIEAFGFGEPGASDFSADELGEVETGTTGNGDQVVIVDDVSKIDQIFSGISLSDDDLGEDVILAGSGNDMIFGDTLVVDPAFVGSEADYAAEIFNDEEGAALRLPLDTIGLADWIEGGAGNDSIMGQAGDDTIMGQAGDDLVYGGDGDDLVHHDLAEETTGAAGNHYDGGRGSDKLVLNLASSDLSDPAVVQAVQDLIAFIAANNDPASGSGSGLLGSFAALGLEVRNFEELEILVDGQPVAPNAESFTLVTNQSGTFSVEADHIAHFGDDGLGGPVALGGVAGAASYTFPDAQAEVSGNFTYTVANDSLDLSDPAAVTLVEDSDDTTLTGTAGRDLIIASGGVLTDNVTVSGAVAAGSTFDTGDDQFSFTLSTGVPGLSITEIVIDLGGGDFDEIGNNGNDFTTGPSNTVAGVSSAVTDGYSTLTITIPAGNFADGDVLTFGIDTDGSKTQTGGDFGDEGIPVTITLSDGTVLSGNYVDGPGSGDNDTSALTITGVAQSTIPSYLLEGQDGDDLLLGSEFGDSLDGGLGNDLLNGGAGDDVLTGGDGADTFAFVYGGFEADTITDFDLAEGDVLDLSDLLGGSLEGADGSQLDDYLSIAVSGGNTIITYETDGWSGPGGPNDGTITLTGVDLESIFGTSSDSQIIDDLLANNALVVD